VAYTPTEDNHPATKSYVDSAVAVNVEENDIVVIKSDGSTFIDVSDSFKEVDGTSESLFMSINPSSSTYIGSDSPIYGVEVAIDTAGNIEEGNVVIEYFDGTSWIESSFMVTDSNEPHLQHGISIANIDNSVEDWRLNFNPYNNTTNPVISSINSISKYWIRLRIVSAISSNPILDMIKVHKDEMRNGSGLIELFGNLRVKHLITSGVNNFIDNAVASPSNEDVKYESGIVLRHKKNELVKDVVDSKALIVDIPRGLDTSVPLEVKIDYYVKGDNAGDIELNLKTVVVDDDFVYDGSALVKDNIVKIETIPANQNRKRRTVKFYALIESGKQGDSYVISISRNGDSVSDTLDANIILTNISVSGYLWTL
jgi:hypothetical protein